MKNVNYSTFKQPIYKEHIEKTKKIIYAKLPNDDEPLPLDNIELKTATQLRLFAEKNDYGFFASAQRPVPYDFILETAYAHTYARANILYGFIIPINGGWLEIGQYENKENATYAPTAADILTAVISPENDPSILPGEVYFRLYPGCALPGIEIVANEDFELLLENRKGQKHILEGDFSSYFSVYADSLSTNEVREVLTPNVMATLIDEFAGTSVELSDKGLFVINSNFSLGDMSHVRDAIGYATLLINSLLYQILDTAKNTKKSQLLPKTSDHYISTNQFSPFSMWSIIKFLIALAIGSVIIGAIVLLDQWIDSI